MICIGDKAMSIVVLLNLLDHETGHIASLHDNKDGGEKLGRECECDNATGIKPNWMPHLCRAVTELKEVVRKLGMSGHFAGSLEAEDQQIKNKTITLEDKGRELKAPNALVWHIYCAISDFVTVRDFCDSVRFCDKLSSVPAPPALCRYP